MVVGPESARILNRNRTRTSPEMTHCRTVRSLAHSRLDISINITQRDAGSCDEWSPSSSPDVAPARAQLNVPHRDHHRYGDHRRAPVHALRDVLRR